DRQCLRPCTSGSTLLTCSSNLLSAVHSRFQPVGKKDGHPNRGSTISFRSVRRCKVQYHGNDPEMAIQQQCPMKPPPPDWFCGLGCAACDFFKTLHKVNRNLASISKCSFVLFI